MSRINYDTLPDCPFCGLNEYEGSGGSSRGSLSSREYKCRVCECFVQQYSHKGGSLLIFVQKEICKDVGHESFEFPGALNIWLNKIMIPTWRDRAKKLKDHESAEWGLWLKDEFYIKFPYLKGKLKEMETVSRFTDNTIAYYECPDEAQELYDNYWNKGFLINEKGNPYKRYRNIGDYISLPDDLKGTLYPPQIPSIPGVSFWVPGKHNDLYISVNYAKSQMLEVPEDPILVSNREFFKDVREQVLNALTSENADHPLSDSMMTMTHTKNRYGGIEPWYTFTILDVEFVIGWRKRVVSITAKSKALPFYIIDVTKLAERDGVTYSADDRYSPVDSMAHQVSIHAWGKEKCVEYLTTIMRSVVETDACRP